jgi:porphobilinogen synthase
MRELVREVRVSASDLILPLFVIDGASEPVEAMPGVQRHSIESAVKTAQLAFSLGIKALMIFPVIEQKHKTLDGQYALDANNIACRVVKAIKEAVPGIGIIGDVALDPYTSHGQDGILMDGVIDNDLTVKILAKQAVALAKSGCDIVAPSDMMDGRIAAVRAALDEEELPDVAILSYAVKYASCFYGPFRDAVGSSASLGKADKTTYQMDPANVSQAFDEVALDIEEGADMIMVKPGMPYLDILSRMSDACNAPLLAYQVSGEYAMIKHAAQAGAFEEAMAVEESLLAFKRAGAHAIATYFALDVAQRLKERASF